METNITKGGLSSRGMKNVNTVIPLMPKTVLEAGDTPNEGDIVDMSVAENWLIRKEVLEIEKEVAEKQLQSEHLSWPKGFHGNPMLLKALAGFMNDYFNPRTPVLPSHIAVAPGAAGCVDALLYNLCDPGDGVLLPGPYFYGYDLFCTLRASAVPILVPILDIADEASFLPALCETYENSSRPIKALLLANPHNPSGRCFTQETLETCLRFCQERNIHFVVDEIFGPLTFNSPDLPQSRPFISVLSLDLFTLGCDPSRVHVIWSPSKVFALSGGRVGCTITQSNPDLRNGLTLASFATISIFSALLTTQVLNSPGLRNMLKVTVDRFSNSYQVVASFLKRMNLPYVPCNAGPCILANIAPHAQSWENEKAMIARLKDAGVLVSPGRSYHMPESAKGWARITFALPPAIVEEGLKRIEKVFKA